MIFSDFAATATKQIQRAMVLPDNKIQVARAKLCCAGLLAYRLIESQTQ